MNDLEQTNMLQPLVDEIETAVSNAKKEIAEKVNSVITETYWKIGKYIVEFEQDGNVKAAYGSKLLTTLSHQLTLRLGRGYSRPNLNNMRKFYLCYENCQTVSDKLTWSHICELIKIDDELERSFYEKECYKEKWDVRTLRRQMDSALFLRLATSRDKEGILALAREGITYDKPEDVIKDTYTLEFLGLPEKERYSEEDLEQKIIDNLQKFLLELGKGFTFVGRQYPLTVNNIHYHVDLVFYHRILKCFVLIDLKKNSVQHIDIGQMNMYMGYFAKEENMADDNPPIGIILSHNKDGDEIIDLGDETEQVLAEMKKTLESEQETELAFSIADCFISIQEVEGGYDYSIMGADYKEIDGGIYDNPDVTIREALHDILEDLKSQPDYNGAKGNIQREDELIPMDYDGLMEKAEEANRIIPESTPSSVVADFKAKTGELFHDISEMNPEEIEETVKCHVQAKIDEYNIDATIVDVAVTGSRCRGLEHESSDLDVVVELSTAEREDDLFNAFNESGLHIGEVKVDINPITAQRTGTLETYLPQVEE